MNLRDMAKCAGVLALLLFGPAATLHASKLLRAES